MPIKSLSILVTAALLVGCKKQASTPAAAPQAAVSVPDMEPDTPLTVDPTVRRGVLDNGIAYFIEHNEVPENKAVLRLAVDAGSLLEDDDQLGIAHFLEHMAFNGTKSFPSNELISYLEGVGTQFGPHLNAHTSFDETVYKLTVPTDDAEVFDKGLQILLEWSCCLTLDPEEIEKERGVVLEEWRTRDGIGRRRTDAIVPLTYHGSRYPDRLPIGTEESLKTFDPQVVKRFYEDWYRPELMAVVVVGDVDVDAVENQIEAVFGQLEPSGDDVRERTEFGVPSHEAHLYDVFVDPELQGSSGWTLSGIDMPRITTWGDLVGDQVAALAITAINTRLVDVARNPKSPFLGLRMGQSRIANLDGIQQLSYDAKEGRVEEAHRRAHLELKRLQEHGITPGMLTLAKKQLIEDMDLYEREAEDVDSRAHADEIVRHFLQQEFMPGTVPEAQLKKKALNAITLEQVNAWAAGFLRGDTQVTMAMVPEKEGITPPTPDSLKAIEADVAATEVQPGEDQPLIDALVPAPTPGTITKRDDTYLESMGFRGYTLSNGVKVYAKDTDFKTEMVLFSSFREGGMSAVPDDGRQFAVARMAERTRLESGMGGHDRSAVDRYLRGSTTSLNTSFNGYDVWISGYAGSRDLPLALEVAYAYHAAPAFTDPGVARTQEVWRDWLKNYFNDPERVFGDTWSLLLEPDDPRSPQLKLEDVDLLNPAAARDIWTRAIGSPDEWTWVFVGDLPDDFEAHLGTWLASIPKSDAGYPKHDRGFRREKGTQRKVIREGTANRARFRTEIWGDLDAAKLDDIEWLTNWDAFGDVLGVKLREKLREDLGGVYGVSGWTSHWTEPTPIWRVRVEFTCDPERVEELENAVNEVMADIAENGVDASYVDAEIAKNREAWEDGQRDNGYWLGWFVNALDEGQDPTSILRHPDVDATLTPDRVQNLAKKHLSTENRTTLILLPGQDAE